MSAAKDNKKRMILPMRRSEEFRDKLKRMTPEEYEAWAERQRNSPLRLPDSKEHLSQLRQFRAAWRRRGRIPADADEREADWKWYSRRRLIFKVIECGKAGEEKARRDRPELAGADYLEVIEGGGDGRPVWPGPGRPVSSYKKKEDA